MKLHKGDINIIERESTEPFIMNIDEVCEVLGVTKPTVHKYIKEGIVPSYKINRKLMFLKSEILQVIKNHRQ